jgi:hypothetical protein
MRESKVKGGSLDFREDKGVISPPMFLKALPTSGRVTAAEPVGACDDRLLRRPRQPEGGTL